MSLPEVVRTARLTLRRPRVADAPALFHNYASDPVVTRFLSWRTNTQLEAVASWLSELDARWNENNAEELSWAICMSDSDAPIGMISLRLAGFKAELGYVLGKAHWGQGLMVEAVRALVDSSFREGLYRVAAFCDVDNAQSARVLEKAGMVREGLLHRYALHPNLSPEPRDVYFYAAYR